MAEKSWAVILSLPLLLANCTGFVGSKEYFANKPQPGALALTNLSATLVAGETRLSRGTNNHATVNCGNATHYAIVERTVPAADPAPAALGDAEMSALPNWQPCGAGGTSTVTLDKTAAGRHVFEIYVLKMDSGEMARAGQLELMRANSVELVSPHPRASANFGSSQVVLPNGNILVGDKGDTTNGVTAGALHLYDGVTGRVIKSIYGASSNEQLGNLDPGFYIFATGYVVTSADSVLIAPSYYRGPSSAYGRCFLMSTVTGEILFEERDAPNATTCQMVAGGPDFRYVALMHDPFSGPSRLEILDGRTGQIVDAKTELVAGSGSSFQAQKVGAQLFAVAAGGDVYLANLAENSLQLLGAGVGSFAGSAGSAGSTAMYVADSFYDAGALTGAGRMSYYDLSGNFLFAVTGEIANERLGSNYSAALELSNGFIATINGGAKAHGSNSGRILVHDRAGVEKIRAEGPSASAFLGGSVATTLTPNAAWPVTPPPRTFFEFAPGKLIFNNDDVLVYDLGNTASPTVLNSLLPGFKGAPYRISANLFVVGGSGASANALSANGYYDLYDASSGTPSLLRSMSGARSNDYYADYYASPGFRDLGGGKWLTVSSYATDAGGIRRGLAEVFSGGTSTPLYSHYGTGTGIGLSNSTPDYVRVLSSNRCVLNMWADSNDSAVAQAGRVVLTDCAGGVLQTFQGALANDRMGMLTTTGALQGIAPLSTGNFLIRSPSLNPGGRAFGGNVKWVSPQSGVVLDEMNGQVANDAFGGIFAETPQAHVLVGSIYATSGAMANAGRVWVWSKPE